MRQLLKYVGFLMKISGYVIINGHRIAATSNILGDTYDVYITRADAELVARNAYKGRKVEVKEAVIEVPN